MSPMRDPSHFAMVPRSDVPRSAFDVRFTHKTTIGAAGLWPIYVDEVLPGDSLRLKMTAFSRLAPLIVPVMDNLYLESFFFYVPNRLLWSNWERFMGEQLTITDSTSFLIPQLPITDADVGAGSVANYFGLQKPAVGETYSVSALPFRAYNLVWSDWFRDQNLQDPPVINLDDGPDALNEYPVRFRGKRHDYFTTALPWPQKNLGQQNTSALGNLGLFNPGADMTFGQWKGAGAPVTGLGFSASSVPTAVAGGSTRYTGARTATPVAQVVGGSLFAAATETGTGTGMFPDIRVLVNDIRTSVMMQRLLERNARGGTRYAELVRRHFGVTPPDFRLQRPEYLGGGRSMINISPVAQTSESTGTGKLAELAAIGTMVAGEHGFSSSFTEHGIILGLVSVRADLSYQAGVNRFWFRRTVFDHYFPDLAHLGEQAILSKEIYCDGSAADDDVFGYQERWAEYRYKPNMITGVTNSFAPAPLDVWHFAQKFTSRPTLNSAFIQTDATGVARPIEVGVFLNEQMILDAQFDLRWVRPLPMYSVPGLGARL